MEHEVTSIPNTGKKKKRWWQQVTWTIYLGHVLSSWGDRMWAFAVGLYLVILFPESLQNPAIFGFSTSISVIVGGPLIGRWVDKTARLTAARWALFVQNLSVILCAVILILFLNYHDELETDWGVQGLDTIFLVLIIIFAVTGELASTASKIVLEKDWIVVLARGDETKLSKMNSKMRTIDLTTQILAPAAVAQIIDFGSETAGAYFIAGWNLISGFFEMYLLHRIYTSIPELGKKKIDGDAADIKKVKSPADNQQVDTNLDDHMMVNGSKETVSTITGSLSASSNGDQNYGSVDGKNEASKKKEGGKMTKVGVRIVESLMGWKLYFRHPIKAAGLGLAFLYMTVLGFDSITIGYLYSQNVDKSILGVLQAAGALFGILGSVSFPFVRKFFGKLSVGIFGFGAQTVCLIPCLVSIFLAGSPFDPESLWQGSSSSSSDGSGSDQNVEDPLRNFTQIMSFTTTEILEDSSYDAAIAFLTGLLLSRYGLWVADLSVTQFFQEEVIESQRGIVNGVQNSMNQFFGLIKFVLVIVFPRQETFGYLIGLSWIFVLMGWISFLIFAYSWRRRRKKKLRATINNELTNNSSPPSNFVTTQL